MHTLPCPSCEQRLTPGEAFAGATLCWPWRRWVSFVCPHCAGDAMLVVGFDAISIGVHARPGTPELELSGRVEPWDVEFTARWASNGLRVSYDGERFTVKAGDD